MRSWMKNVIFSLIVSIVFMIFLEGVASVAFHLRREIDHSNEKKNLKFIAEYDPVLGWRFKSGHWDNYYGLGKSLTINQMGMRSSYEFQTSPPKGMQRILCLGDSFTMGEELGDTQTWCDQLRKMNPNIETMNMGVGGYGLDQIYLWFLDTGLHFDTSYVIVGLFHGSFDRMLTGRYHGYGKPFLTVVDNKIHPAQVPVPRTHLAIRLAWKWYIYLEPLNSFQALKRISAFICQRFSRIHTSQQVLEISEKIFTDLKKISADKRAELVIVYFPTLAEVLKYQDHSKLQAELKDILARGGIRFLDLSESFYKIPTGEITSYYLNYHYSQKGSAFVAGKIYENMNGINQKSTG